MLICYIVDVGEIKGHFCLSASGAIVHPILVVTECRGPASLTSAAFFLGGERVIENRVQSLGHVHLLWPLSTHYPQHLTLGCVLCMPACSPLGFPKLPF